MLAARRVDAPVSQSQTLHRFASHDVRVDDFIHILQLYSAVPHRIRVDHQVRPMLTLIETARLVGADSPFQAAFCELLLEQLLQFNLSLGITASARMSSRPLVPADEDVLLKSGHGGSVQGPTTSGATSGAFIGDRPTISGTFQRGMTAQHFAS